MEILRAFVGEDSVVAAAGDFTVQGFFIVGMDTSDG